MADNGNLVERTLRRFCSKLVEAAGIEPSDDFGASDSCICDCENCQQCRAAYALHLECFKEHLMASFDADLQGVIVGWNGLPASTRKAIVTLAGSR